MMADLLSVGQVAFFLAFGWTLCTWLIAELVHHQRSKRPAPPAPDMEEVEEDMQRLLAGGNSAKGGPDVTTAHITAVVKSVSDTEAGLGAATMAPAPIRISPSKASAEAGLGHGVGVLQSCARSGLVRCMLLDVDAIVQQRLTLRAMVEFGALMAWYFVCDRTDVVGHGPKSYSRDLFLFLFVILTAVAAGASLQTVKAPLLLNRPQTEEWKGWMQVLFLLYHYFEAKEVYNAIRLFIAAYVWMTGYGNFSYYYKTGDFSIGRFAQMLWRLNFLVFFACIVLHNSYMLYYICPMHTIFTVMVYACLAIAPQLNASNVWIWIKMLLCLVSVVVLWDMKAVFYAIWSPVVWLVGYTDPRRSPDLPSDPLYEWYFRSGLDRYVWIYGMICAFLHPTASAAMRMLEELAVVKRAMMRMLLLSVCGVVGNYWYIHVYCLPKAQYNAAHPYTSWIPITLWIVVRNMLPRLRLHHLRLYGWLGCITLETYISQFHIWMRTQVPDGQPKALLVLLPGYPLLNFAACTALYILISHRLFELTNTLKNAAVPHSNNPLLARNILLLGTVCATLYGVTWVVVSVTMGSSQ